MKALHTIAPGLHLVGLLLFCVLLVCPLRTFAESNASISRQEGTSTKSAPQIGAYYYPWWGNPNNPHWDDGLLRHELEPYNQEPMLGEYFNQNMTVINQHLEWAQQYGITQFIAAWFGPNGFGDRTIRDYLMTRAEERRSLSSSSSQEVRIGLLYESPSRLKRDASDNKVYFNNATNNAQTLLDDFKYLAQNYFHRPSYLKYNGKPVVYLYLARSFRGDYASAFDQMRSVIRDTYNYELYLVADVVYWGAPDPDYIRVFDAITAYNMHGPVKYDGYPQDTGFLVDVEAKYQQYQKVANNLEVDFIPGIMPAYNDRAVRLANDHYVIPHEMSASEAGKGQYSTFQESFQMAERVLVAQSQTSQVTRSSSTIMITSWNEWHEDTNIEPTKGTAASSTEPKLYSGGYEYEDYGFSLLQVVAEFLQHDTTTTTEAPNLSIPTAYPTTVPTFSPTMAPVTTLPTHVPTFLQPTQIPTQMLSSSPTITISTNTTETPTTSIPTAFPTTVPTFSPTVPPTTSLLTAVPTSLQPTETPTQMPSSSPTVTTNTNATEAPTTSIPTALSSTEPTFLPTLAPITSFPTLVPTSLQPTSLQPIPMPSSYPTIITMTTDTPSTIVPTNAKLTTLPTRYPTTAVPTPMPFLSTFPPSVIMLPQQKKPSSQPKCGSLANVQGYGGVAGRSKECDSGNNAVSNNRPRKLRGRRQA